MVAPGTPNEQLFVEAIVDTNVASRNLDRFGREVGRVAGTVSRDINNFSDASTSSLESVADASQDTTVVLTENASSVRNSFDIADVALSQFAATATRTLRGLTAQFVEFQKQIIDIIKVVSAFSGQSFGSSQVQSLASSLNDLGTVIPIANAELRTIGRDLAQLGFFAQSTAATIESDIVNAVELVGKTSAALGVSAGETGQAFGILRNIFLDTDQSLQDQLSTLVRYSSVLNELQNTTAGVSSFMLEFNQRIGATATTIGLSFQEISGFGAAIAELGQSAQVGATALQNLFIRAQRDASAFAETLQISRAEFQKEFNTAPYETLVRFLSRLNQLTPEYRSQLIGQITESQRAVTAINGLVNNVDVLTRSVDTANKAFEDGTSINREFELISQQLSASLTRLGNVLNTSVVRGFAQLEPLIVPVVNAATSLLTEFGAFSAVLSGAAVAFSALAAVGLGYLIVAPKIRIIVQSLIDGYKNLSEKVSDYAQSFQELGDSEQELDQISDSVDETRDRLDNASESARKLAEELKAAFDRGSLPSANVIFPTETIDAIREADIVMSELFKDTAKLSPLISELRIVEDRLVSAGEALEAELARPLRDLGPTTAGSIGQALQDAAKDVTFDTSFIAEDLRDTFDAMVVQYRTAMENGSEQSKSALVANFKEVLESAKAANVSYLKAVKTDTERAIEDIRLFLSESGVDLDIFDLDTLQEQTDQFSQSIKEVADSFRDAGDSAERLTNTTRSGLPSFEEQVRLAERSKTEINLAEAGIIQKVAAQSRLNDAQRQSIANLAAMRGRIFAISSSLTAVGVVTERLFGGSGTVALGVGSVLSSLAQMTPLLQGIATAALVARNAMVSLATVSFVTSLGGISAILSQLGRIPVVGRLAERSIRGLGGTLARSAANVAGRGGLFTTIASTGPAAAKAIAAVSIAAKALPIALIGGAVAARIAIKNLSDDIDDLQNRVRRGVTTTADAIEELNERLQFRDGFFTGRLDIVKELAGLNNELREVRTGLIDAEVAALNYLRSLSGPARDTLEDLVEASAEGASDIGGAFLRNAESARDDFDKFWRSLFDGVDAQGAARAARGLVDPLRFALEDGLDIDAPLERIIDQLQKAGVSVDNIPTVASALLTNLDVAEADIARVQTSIEESARRRAVLALEEFQNRERLKSLETDLSNILSQQQTQRTQLANQAVEATKKITQSILSIERERQDTIVRTERALQEEIDNSIFKIETLRDRLREFKDSVKVDEALDGSQLTVDTDSFIGSPEDLQNVRALTAEYNRLVERSSDLQLALSQRTFEQTILAEDNPIKKRLEDARDSIENLGKSFADSLEIEKINDLIDANRDLGESFDDQIDLIRRRGEVERRELQRTLVEVRKRRDEEISLMRAMGTDEDQIRARTAEFELEIQEATLNIRRQESTLAIETAALQRREAARLKDEVEDIVSTYRTFRNSLDEEIQLISSLEELQEALEVLEEASAQGVEVEEARSAIAETVQRIYRDTYREAFNAEERLRQVRIRNEREVRGEQLDAIEQAENRLREAQQQERRNRGARFADINRGQEDAGIRRAREEGILEIELLKIEQERRKNLEEIFKQRDALIQELEKEIPLNQQQADQQEQQIQNIREQAKEQARLTQEEAIRAEANRRAQEEIQRAQDEAGPRGPDRDQRLDLQERLEDLRAEAEQQLRRLAEGVEDGAIEEEVRGVVNEELQAVNDVKRATGELQALQAAMGEARNNEIDALQEVLGLEIKRNAEIEKRLGLGGQQGDPQQQGREGADTERRDIINATVGDITENLNTIFEEFSLGVTGFSDSFAQNVTDMNNSLETSKGLIENTSSAFGSQVQSFANSVDTSITAIEGTVDNIVGGIDSLNTRLSRIEQAFERAR